MSDGDRCEAASNSSCLRSYPSWQGWPILKLNLCSAFLALTSGTLLWRISLLLVIVDCVDVSSNIIEIRLSDKSMTLERYGTIALRSQFKRTHVPILPTFWRLLAFTIRNKKKRRKRERERARKKWLIRFIQDTRFLRDLQTNILFATETFISLAKTHVL